MWYDSIYLGTLYLTVKVHYFFLKTAYFCEGYFTSMIVIVFIYFYYNVKGIIDITFVFLKHAISLVLSLNTYKSPS